MVPHSWNLCFAFNPSKHWTHTWRIGQPFCYGAQGATGGSVPCSRVTEGGREGCSFIYNSCQYWDLIPSPLGYKSDSLTIRPLLPHKQLCVGTMSVVYVNKQCTLDPDQLICQIKSVKMTFCGGLWTALRLLLKLQILYSCPQTEGWHKLQISTNHNLKRWKFLHQSCCWKSLFTCMSCKPHFLNMKDASGAWTW